MIKHNQVYDRHSTVPIGTVLEVLQAAKLSKSEFNGINVNTRSLRLQTFLKKGLVCVKCGRVGTHFAIERGAGQQTYHINLWAVDEQGDEYLMTHDHIIARSLGGADNINNTQTMCSPCNFEKSIDECRIKREQT